MKRFSLVCAALLAVVGLALPTASAATAAPDAVVAVSGTVTDAVTGEPVADVCVSTRQAAPLPDWWNQQVCTDANGDFAFGLKPGRYQVEFDPTDDAFGEQWWPQVDSPADARFVVVKGGVPITDLDASLQAGATMTGRAIDGATGKPLADACIEVSASSELDTVAWLNGVDGSWEVRGLPPGDLTVLVRRCSNYFRFTWAYDALTINDATVFDLQPGATTAVGDLALVKGATLKGRVTARKTGEPLAKQIGLDYTGAARSGEPPIFGAVSKANGKYVIRDIQPGAHTPGAFDSWPYKYATQWAGGATSMADGTVYDLKPGEVAHANFALDRASMITGTLAGAEDWVTVDAFSDSYLEVGNRAAVGYPADVNPDTGEFTIYGLPAADTYLSFDGSYYQPGGFWFDGVRDVVDATLIHLKVGKTTKVTAHFPTD